MRQLNQIIAEATAAISAPYFHLPICGGEPAWRERVYCYELYHQMRLLWPQNCPLILTGELDKRAHPIFEKLQARQSIPDLLVHTPGEMHHNCAVIEIKSQQAQRHGIRKDMKTLDEFRDLIGYQRAIFLVFGSDFPMAGYEIGGDIEVWHHAKVGQPARCYGRSN